MRFMMVMIPRVYQPDVPPGEKAGDGFAPPAYDDVLRKYGNFAGGEALQSARNAAILRWMNGMVSVADGPFAETKEQLGGIEEMSAVMVESERRHLQARKVS